MVLDMVLTIYMWMIIGRVIISWVNADPYNPIVRFLYSATEPILYRVRRALPSFGVGLDFSPLLVILGIYFLKGFLVMSLYDVARQMRVPDSGL